MRFQIAAAAMIAGASASYGYGYPQNTTSAAGYTTEAPYPVYTTSVVTELTTYCPGPTKVTHGGVTYTVTEATTLTITDCPCTVTYPVETPVYTPNPSKPGESAPPTYPSAPAPYPSANGTVPAPPAGTGYPTTAAATTAPPAFTGAATKAGAGLMAVAAGLAAFL